MGLLDSLPDEKGGMLDSLPDEPVAKVEKPKRSLLGEAGAGVAQTTFGLPQMVGGVTKLAGDAIGSETVSALGKDAINYWGDKMKPYAAEVPSFTDIEDAGDAAKYVAHGVGALVPTVAASVVSGGIGAGLAKEGVKRAIAKEIVKRELKHEAVDLMAKGAVKETVKKAVTRGAIAGAGAASYGMEAGSIYTDQAEQGIKKPLRAALTAVPAAALDVIPELRLLSKIPAFKVLQEIPFFKTAEGRNALVRGGKEALKQGGAEGVTEFAQTLIERYGADKEAFSKEGLLEAANAGILGGIGGGMMGGVAGSVQKPATDTNLLNENSEETSDIAQEILRVRNQPAVPSVQTVTEPPAMAVPAYEGPVMDAEAPTPEDLELQAMQRENENYRQQQLMDKQDIPTVEEKSVPQVPSSFKTADGKVSVKTKAVGEGVFQVETTNIDEYGHKKTFVQEMNAEDAVKHIDNVTPPVTRDQYLQVKGVNDEAMSEVQSSNAEGNQEVSEVRDESVGFDEYLKTPEGVNEYLKKTKGVTGPAKKMVMDRWRKEYENDSPETGGVVRPIGEGAQPGGAVSDTAASALPTSEGGGMLSEGQTVETASSKESKASDEASKTAPKVVIKSLSDLPPGQHEIKGAGTFLVDEKGRVKILRGTKLESVDPMRRKLAIDKYNGMVLAGKQKANREALKVGKTKQKAMAEEARGIAEDDAPFLRAALQNVKDADFGKISVDGNETEATWSTFGALIPYIRGMGFSKADAVKIMAEAVETGKLPPEKNKAERSLVESALKHEKERIEEAENRVETEDERLAKAEREAIENEGGDTSFDFSDDEAAENNKVSQRLEEARSFKHRNKSYDDMIEYGEKADGGKDGFYSELFKYAFKTAKSFNAVMTAQNGNPVGVEYQDSKGERYAYIAPEPGEKGKYRIQYFDKGGFSSHAVEKDLPTAVTELVRQGFTTEAKESLDKVSGTLEFQRGNEVSALIGKLNRGEIDHAEFAKRREAIYEEPAESTPLMEGDQSKLFPTPPTFGKKPQGTGTVSETPMLTEMKEREAESKQTSMTLDMLGMQQIYESLTDGVMKEHATTALDKVRNTLDNPGGLGTLGNWKQYLAKRYKTLGMLSGIKDFTHQITKTFGKASENDRKAIFEFLTDKQGDASTISPALREESIKMKQMIEDIGDKLVAYGLITQKVMDEHRGEYLPTVYLKHILGKEGFQAMGSGKKLDLTYTKKKYLRKSLKEQGLTEEEIDLFMRTQMGEIKDPAYLLARAFSIPSRDMAIIDWLAEIATHSEWVMPKSLIEWTHSENPVRRSGRVEYKKNADGSFDLKIHKTKMVETKHTVTASALGKLIGSDKIADYIKAGKGKQQTRKDEVKGKVVYKATPWKKVGHIQYKLNPDGTFTLKIKEKVTSVDELSGVKDFKGLVGEKKADQILNDEGKALGGRKVTPFWLAAEAKRIREMIPHLPEADRAEAKAVADRMQRLSDEADVSGKLPDDYRQMPDSAKYGALRGLVVRKEIYSDLVGNINISIGEKSLPEEWLGTGGKITKLTGMWKWAKVAANPPAQVRNFVSNLVLLNLSGIPVYRVPIRMAQAVKEIRSNGKHWQVAKKYGVKEATFSNTELARIETALMEMANRDYGFARGMKKLASSLAALDMKGAKEGAGAAFNPVKLAGAKVVNLTGDAYQFMEAMGKTAKIIDEMENGKSGEAAAMEAHKWLFDYSLVSPGVKYLRNAPIGIPFITFMTKVLPRLTEVAVTKPWRFTPYVAIAYGMQAAVAGMLDVDDEDLDKLREALPEWIREKQHVYFLPFKDDAGRWQVVDLGYFFPWTQWTTFVEDVGEGDLWKAMRGSGILGGPLPDLIVALKTNVDPFTQRPIIDKYADPAEKAAQMFGYLYQMAMPPWLTQRGTAGKLYSALSENVDKFGLPKATVKQAGLSMAGINLSGFDPALTRGQNLKRMDFEISEVQRQAKSELQNKNLSDSEREEIREKFKKRIQKMNLKKMKYAANSMPKDQSLLQR